MHIGEISKLDQIKIKVAVLELELMFDTKSHSEELELIAVTSVYQSELDDCQSASERMIELEQHLINLQYLDKHHIIQIDRSNCYDQRL